MLTGDGRVRIATPRERDGSFEPLLLPKGPSLNKQLARKTRGASKNATNKSGKIEANHVICRLAWRND